MNIPTKMSAFKIPDVRIWRWPKTIFVRSTSCDVLEIIACLISTFRMTLPSTYVRSWPSLGGFLPKMSHNNMTSRIIMKSICYRVRIWMTFLIFFLFAGYEFVNSRILGFDTESLALLGCRMGKKRFPVTRFKVMKARNFLHYCLGGNWGERKLKWEIRRRKPGLS